jgi:acyl-CoA thioester hydrolase
MKESMYIKKIFYHDTDCGGVVYYANYLKYLEEARTECLTEKGISLKDLANQDTWFVVARVQIDYKSPACYQDILTIITTVEKTRASVVQFFQQVLKDTTVVAEAQTVLVCVGSDLKPKPLPEEIRKALKATDI